MKEIAQNLAIGIKEIKQNARDKWFMLSQRDKVRYEIKIVD